MDHNLSVGERRSTKCFYLTFADIGANFYTVVLLSISEPGGDVVWLNICVYTGED